MPNPIENRLPVATLLLSCFTTLAALPRPDARALAQPPTASPSPVDPNRGDGAVDGSPPAASPNQTDSLPGTASSEGDKNETAKLARLAKEFGFTRTEGGENESMLRLIETPLLTFTNPVRGRDQVGSIFLWTHEKRPMVVASLWTFAGNDQQRKLSIELHALTSQTYSTSLPEIPSPRRRLPNWIPPEKPVVWNTLTANPLAEPGKNRLRSLLRRFAGKIQVKIVDPQSGQRETLRRLSQPLYEYQSDRVAMGALFADVMATDPEALLLIEARRHEGTITVHYALARMTGRELIGEMDGEEVWSTDRAPVWDGSAAYYFCPNVAEY